MKQIRVLLDLWGNRRRASATLRKLALEHVKECEDKARKLQEMAQTLKHLAEHCRGDERPGCPILQDIAGQDAARLRH